jgi:hypothetical protein
MPVDALTGRERQLMHVVAEACRRAEREHQQAQLEVRLRLDERDRVQHVAAQGQLVRAAVDGDAMLERGLHAGEDHVDHRVGALRLRGDHPVARLTGVRSRRADEQREQRRD